MNAEWQPGESETSKWKNELAKRKWKHARRKWNEKWNELDIDERMRITVENQLKDQEAKDRRSKVELTKLGDRWCLVSAEHLRLLA